ncbi:MAG TPA: hypothetical protein VMF58_03275 [Rhizomicrobium sp.]|nr:hypothetical protein [Rhizomicrobium sp.]
MFRNAKAVIAAAALTLLPAALPAHADPTIVQSAMGGSILGYDVDRGGTLGILSEFVPHNDGTNDVAVETFDLATGVIVKTIRKKTDTKDDYLVLGVVGAGAGLVETEYTRDIFVDKRTYNVIDPLNSRKFTGAWTPPTKKNDILLSASVSTGASTTAIMGFSNTSKSHTFVFASDVAGNTFGPKIKITDPLFDFNDSPVMAYDSVLNLAILGASRGCNPECTANLLSVDLMDGTQSKLGGVGHGFVNGIAADEADGIVATATELDFSVEFFYLSTHHVNRVVLQGATSQTNSGTDVQFDPIHKLFFIGQPFSSTGPNSSIQVYDPNGNFVESINNLHLPTSSSRIALDPALRKGFVQSSQDGSQLQVFTY